jgi:hypothetical protein
MDELAVDLACASCGQSVEKEHKFCPWCGQRLVQAPTKPRAQQPQRLVIQFPAGPHPSLTQALKVARSHASFREVETPDGTVYRVSFAETALVATAELAALADRLLQKKVYVRGREARWEEIFRFLPCYLLRQMHEKPENHCFGEEKEGTFNLWGCLQAELPFSAEGAWCTWGKFDQGTTRFRFNRGRLRNEVDGRLIKVRYCPALTPDFVNSVLRAFPKTVDPRADRDWTFIQARAGQEGMTVVVSTGFGGKERITVLGVAPRGRGAARAILSKASRLRQQE